MQAHAALGCIRVAGAPAVFHEELMRQHLYFGVRAIQYSCRVNTAHAVRLQDHLTTPAVHETTPVAHTFPAGKSYMCAPRIGLAPALPLRLPRPRPARVHAARNACMRVVHADDALMHAVCAM